MDTNPEGYDPTDWTPDGKFIPDLIEAAERQAENDKEARESDRVCLHYRKAGKHKSALCRYEYCPGDA